MTAERLERLFQRVQNGPIHSGWHWLSYNFTFGSEGSMYFAPLTLTALDKVDQVMPGYADAMLTRLEGMGGREKNMDDYAAIIQWLAELVVMFHLARHTWPDAPIFEMEPRVAGSKKNPEAVIRVPGVGSLGVEVKAPKLEKHRLDRGSAPWQMVERGSIDPASLEGGVTLPRDNPIKDFLISADAKFAGFRDAYEDFRSVLVIVADDYVNEPLSALLSPASGLLTPNSFHKDEAGNIVTYPNVDAIVIVRHQHQFRLGMANESAVDQRKHFLDYGGRDDFPPHVVIPNPTGQALRPEWLEALGAWPLEALNGAEYNPGGVVMWQETIVDDESDTPPSDSP